MDDVKELIARLEAWGPLVSRGLVCPAAGTAMHEAAAALSRLADAEERAWNDGRDAAHRIAALAGEAAAGWPSSKVTDTICAHIRALKRQHRRPEMSETTARGFRIDSFTDANGNECSLQISSAARDEGMIWLGCNDIGLKRFVPKQGWQDVELEQEPLGVHHVANNRMHLSQSQVRALLPALQHFAETGDLP